VSARDGSSDPAVLPGGPAPPGPVARALRALPGLLRTGLVEVVAYRAEFAIWILVGLLPLVMLALMHTVAREAPIGGLGPEEVTAYYLAVMLVRMVTGSWVLWELHEDVRLGTLSLRLLRPVHPLLEYAAGNLAALPLRGLLAIPFAAILLAVIGSGIGPAGAAGPILCLVSLAAAWLVTFLLLSCVACGVFWFDRVLSLWELYLGLYSVLSGFVLPLELFPRWFAALARWLPFRYQITVPVDVMLGRLTGSEAIREIGLQCVWVALLATAFRFAWRAGLRRYEAYGG